MQLRGSSAARRPAADARRGAADRGEYRQAAGAVALGLSAILLGKTDAALILDLRLKGGIVLITTRGRQ